MRCHSTNKNFLNFTKFLNKQPNSTIVSSYLSHQFAFLSNLEAKYTHITLTMRYDSRPKEREANYSV